MILVHVPLPSQLISGQRTYRVDRYSKINNRTGHLQLVEQRIVVQGPQADRGIVTGRDEHVLAHLYAGNWTTVMGDFHYLEWLWQDQRETVIKY